tara:strand:+ start:120 stop:689 length:570 start_codon:yes stop_codon:yes gene_type:complete
MRITTLAATAFAGLTLAGCINVDLTATVTGPDSVRLSGYTEVQTEILDMMGGAAAFCNAEEGGTLEMTETHARCNVLIEGTFGEVFVAEAGEPVPTATDLGDGTVRLSFPVRQMTADASEMRNDPQTMTMMRPMLEGQTFVMRIAGEEIISSNGTIAEDGKSASFGFPLIEVLNAEYQFPETFEAVVRY